MITEKNETVISSGNIGTADRRSDAIQEIILYKPGVLERWALLIFIFILAGLIASTWFIQYPDIVTAKARLVANDSLKNNIPKGKEDLTGGYYAEVQITQLNFGKIQIGQTVLLQFDAYPYQEFGQVNGKLKSISTAGTDSGFLAHIELPMGLVTNYDKKLPYRKGLTAQAQIITKEMRLAEKFYSNIMGAINKRPK